MALTQIKRNLLPYNLILAAGSTTGESYILSDALARVVERYTNINIDVCATDGTEDNLKSLEGLPLTNYANCQSGLSTIALTAQLATAQADSPPGASARIIANLYEDKFQLLVNPQKIQLPPNIQTFDIASLRGRTIETPEGGGQRQSFDAIANHFNLNFSFLDLGGDLQLQSDKIDAIFRVRVLGNEGIRQLIRQGWQLVPIEQAPAMQSTKHPAYEPSIIPKGSYQGSPPIPNADLNTIAVQRTLLVREDVPDWVVETITAILNEHRQEIKNFIDEIAQERDSTARAFEADAVKPLVETIRQPARDGNVQLHQGALAYYDRNEPSFVQENADFLALILTLALLAGSWLLQLKAWRDRRRQQKVTDKAQEQENKANDYIGQVVDKMKLKTLGVSQQEESDPFSTSLHAIVSQTSTITPSQLLILLSDLFERQESLDQVFGRASQSLDDKTISQEGFRAFSEAYQSAQEVIERTIEENQRKFSSYYVAQVMEILQRLNAGEDPALLANTLSRAFDEAAAMLIEEKIFSRESFRTFTEAYNLVKNAIEGVEHKRRQD